MRKNKQEVKNHFELFLEAFRAAGEAITVNYPEKEIILPETVENDERVYFFFDKNTGRYLDKTIE